MSDSRFLMCPPDYFGVEYVINPWMRGNLGKVTGSAAVQWNALYRLLTETLSVTVELATPQPGLPDMVFTANAGLVRGSVSIPARFRHKERQGEEPHFRQWFTRHRYTLRDLPEGISFEGEGDALFDGEDYDLLWAAMGFRSDAAAHSYLADILDVEVVPLGLVDERFYHLDTCFTPLPHGYFLWYPPAFDAESQARILRHIPEPDRHALSDEDAAAFACNAIPVGENDIVLNDASPTLTDWLNRCGFTVHATPLTEFMKAGGSAKCLVLRLP
jgi:N-dimethylarginine dimethylaminohydrolase